MATTTTTTSANGIPTSSVGIIVPPPAKKLIIDRTATFVAAKGRHVEEEILNRQQGGANASSFTFLLEEDPYHAYYLAKIQELQAGVAAALPAPTAPAAAAAAAPEPAEKESSAPVLSNALTIAMKLAQQQQQDKAASAPPPLEFTLELPLLSGITRDSVEHQLIHLTAQFAATDGKKFEADLQHHIKQTAGGSGAEDASEFSFVFPQSPLHKYYTDLVRCYRVINTRPLHSNLAYIADLASGNGQILLNRAVLRYEERRAAERAKLEAQSEEAKALERQQFLEIDWHDFVIVETITFDQHVPDQQQQQQTVDQFIQRTTAAAREEERDGMVVRSDFQVEPVRLTKSTPLVSLPDGKRVPVTQMNAHIRTEQLDPKWREHQDRFDKRQRETNLVESSSMFTNLARMAEARPDVFGGEAEEAIAREEEKRKREAERIVWDGNMLTADSVKAAVVASTTANIAAATVPPPPLFPGSAQPPPLLPPLPPPMPEPKRARLEEQSAQAEQAAAAPAQDGGLEITIPSGAAGAPAAAQQLAEKIILPHAEIKSDMTVQEFKELLSRNHLANILVGKFQLKAVDDGRFLKNTDLVSSIGARLEIKWKSR